VVGPIIASFAMSGMGASVIFDLDAKLSGVLGSWVMRIGLSWWKSTRAKMRAAIDPKVAQKMRVRPTKQCQYTSCKYWLVVPYEYAFPTIQARPELAHRHAL
jgi:hypothetical protein